MRDWRKRKGLAVLKKTAEACAAAVERGIKQVSPTLRLVETGTLLSVGRGTAIVDGLPGVQSEEMLLFPGGTQGLAFNLDADEIGVVILGDHEGLETGMEVRRSGRVLDMPVGDALVGRVVDASGAPLDGGGRINCRERRRVEIDAPPIMDRAPVTTPLQTGIKAVDALIPLGKGQRELILGDRQTGKTAIALDAIINQRDKDVLCVYCAIGQRDAAVANVVSDLRRHDAMGYTVVVVASCADAAGLQFIAPYAATTIAEFFMAEGRDVLIVYDDLTQHARAYRELSLLLKRPPGREAFPGDIFYVHSRLLERSTHLRKEKGGGSLTALPIIETEAQNISAYIPTNLISITDGQLYLSPQLFRKGQMPAINVGKSVSRVGGKAQLRAYREVAGDLRLSYSQFEELERFARFGTRLDKDTRQALEHGYRVRAILRQPQFEPIPAADQIAALLAVAEGLLDNLPIEHVPEFERQLRRRLAEDGREVRERLEKGDSISDEDRQAILRMASELVNKDTETGNAEPGGDETTD